jgi:hypothetical protein
MTERTLPSFVQERDVFLGMVSQLQHFMEERFQDDNYLLSRKEISDNAFREMKKDAVVAPLLHARRLVENGIPIAESLRQSGADSADFVVQAMDASIINGGKVQESAEELLRQFVKALHASA